MSLIQRLITALVPRSWAQDIEAESRTWLMRCPCGHARSLWDAGGIRWKAAGTPRRLMRCPGCGKRTWQTIARRREGDQAAGDRGGGAG